MAKVERIEYEDFRDVRRIYHTDGNVEVEFKKSDKYPFVLFRKDKVTDHVEYVDAWGDEEGAQDDVEKYNQKYPNYEYYYEDYSEMSAGWYLVDCEEWD